MRHKPVLLEEALRALNLKRGDVAVDGTLGNGGHSLEIVKRIGPEGRLVGLDQDPSALEISRERLRKYQKQISLHHENFLNLGQVLDALNISEADAVLLDIGFSSDQLEDASRGFSFERTGPLDMRMNPDLEICARDLVNRLSEKELADLFYRYGEERKSRRLARVICERRRKQPFETTQDLTEALFGCPRSGHRTRIHPATRIFQALRIAVNRELEILEQALPRIWNRLKSQGRLAVISFHSLEDRIVKHQFQRWSRAGEAVLVAKKPITASWEEIKTNPRARSAKLRAIEKIA